MSVTKENILACIEKGMKNKDIFKHFSISKATLRRLFIKYDITTSKKKNMDIYENLTEKNIRELSELGLSVDLASEKMGVSRSCFSKKASEFNISFRKVKFNIEEYNILQNRGMPDKDIAEHFGMTAHGLYCSKVALGIATEPRNFDVIPKDVLEELYINKKLAISKISDILNKGYTSIYSYILKYKLKLRREDGVFVNKDKLKKLMDKDYSYQEMSEIFRTSEDSVKKALIINDFDSEELFSSEGISLNRLTEQQKQLVYGTMLGDAYLGGDDYSNKRLRITHGLKQKEYIEHKLSILHNFISPSGLELKPRLDKRTEKTHIAVTFSTIKSRLFTDIFPLFYNPEKYINEEVLYYLDGLGLSYWFMDDGYLYGNSSLVLCTECFVDKDLNKIVKYFKHKWNITCDIDTELRRVFFFDEEGLKFQKIIEPHILPYFSYKLMTTRKRPMCEKRATLVSEILNNLATLGTSL